MKELKLTLSHSTLKVMVDSLKHVCLLPENDFERIIDSLHNDLLLRLHKKLLENRLSQKMKFKLHDGIALRHLLTVRSYPDTSYEENELRILLNLIDKQL